ncbi:maleylpyruvate isomerase family mycothiol-dependent enzyme [Nocardioides limicola]|uniref:maleylpyruvate isomerase family mycothiol-dependent enzyme n=1 Tax=Nocardioides limicola TaxID=2803368 RepID=UPI0027DBB186|nr:maleylpyruvate isomerase family mycothiol-dependent enzyme [Nocardioides sp. DJM-14]
MENHLEWLARLQGEFLADVRVADPTLPVPACGRWRIKNLVEHLARVHHWAAGQARRSQETPLGRGPFDLPALYDECATELRTTLAELDPAADAWTLVGRGPVSFWHRRQLHETLIHLHDLRAAQGNAVNDVPVEVWSDCIDELITMFVPRQIAMERLESLSRTVRFVAADAQDAVWVMGSGDAEATVRAPARELALVLWHRIPLESAGATIEGDAAAVHTLLAQPLTP